MDKGSWRGIKNSLGPGLLMAAAAVGVSHLVQSTRAGADYGFALTWVIVLAVLFKYPFLEFGPRYAIAARESMIDGYKRLGNWALVVFLTFTLLTMFIIHAAVTVVTASLAAELTGIALSGFHWSLILLIICFLVLFSGRYSALDGIMKLIMAVLVLSTLAAIITLFFAGNYTPAAEAVSPAIWTAAGISFVIALMGWMPIPIDAAAWHSIWTLERIEQTRYTPKLNESLIDFRIGYIGAGLLALCFLFLGAVVMFGTNIDFASSGAVFSKQLIALYTSTIGDWSYTIIIICTFTTMFSTTLAVTDAYPRVCRKLAEVQWPSDMITGSKKFYQILLFIVISGTLFILYFLADQFTLLIDLATTLSFLAAPVLAYMNYRLVMMDHIADDMKPPRWLRYLSVCGILFLSLFALIYIYYLVSF